MLKLWLLWRLLWLSGKERHGGLQVGRHGRIIQYPQRPQSVFENHPLRIPFTLSFGLDAVIAPRFLFSAFDAPFPTCC